MGLVKGLINSKIYISLAAVFLTIETQIQLGLEPQWHPYLFIIFFATLFEYNLHQLVIIVTNKGALKPNKYSWVKKNMKVFYGLTILSMIGFISVIFMAKKEVLITFAPMAAITFLYSIPLFVNKRKFFRLREIPYLKIFLIAFVWTFSTIFLPVIQSDCEFNKVHVIAMLVERFFFIFAITIPFDIRDKEADKQAGLKTIPLLFTENKSYIISYLFLLIFFLVSVFHYQIPNQRFIILSISISTVTTFIFLYSKKIRNFNLYHYGILDGTMLLQGLLVLLFYYMN